MLGISIIQAEFNSTIVIIIIIYTVNKTPQGRRAVQISFSLAFSQTPAYTARSWMSLYGASASCGVVCLFTSQLSLILTVPSHGRMARLS